MRRRSCRVGKKKIINAGYNSKQPGTWESRSRTAISKSLLTTEEASSASRGSDGGGLARQRVFSSTSFSFLFCFSAQTKEATEPKNIAHPKNKEPSQIYNLFFFV